MKQKIKKLFSIAVLLLLCILFFLTTFAQIKKNAPILLLTGSNNFGLYTGEMLKAEGFNEFKIASLKSHLTQNDLKGFDIVIITETSVTESQRDVLSQFVKNGGSLIAFRPDKKLNNVFGIKYGEDTISDRYIAINPKEQIGLGITSASLQFHGAADKCTATSAKAIAFLFKDAVTITKFPAIVLNNYGKGCALAFMYNLPKSIVCTRQGNSESAGQEMDGIEGLRAMDLFTNGWVDTSKNTLNQADEQMRLLAHGIEKMMNNKKPLPRFWYFPDTLKCVVTLNNDGEDSKESDYAKQFADVDSKGAKMTLYIKEVNFTSKDWVDKWKHKGFEIAAHYDDTKQAGKPDWRTMDSVYKSLNEKMKTLYGIDSIRTVVNHWFVWCGNNIKGEKDFAAQAKIEALNGILLDANYAHYDNGSNHGHFLGTLGNRQGNFIGSGLPMKFSDQQGGIVNVYQHFNNVYDQQYMEHRDKDGFFDCFRGLVDRSMENGTYSFVSIKAHNAEYFFSEEPLMKMLDYANSKKIPVWTEIKLLEFLRAKDEATFRNIEWKKNTASFIIKSSLCHSSQLTCMQPYFFKGKKIKKIRVDGIPKTFSIATIKGSKYALFMIMPGKLHNASIAYY